MEKLVLKNGSEIKIEPGASLSRIGVVSASKEEMIVTWDLLTVENLKEVQIKNAEGEVIGEYTDLVLENETSVVQTDGSIITYFSLRAKTEVELLKEQSKEQSEAIDMLTACVLEMSEQVYA